MSHPEYFIFVCQVNLQVTKLFIVTSATKGGWLQPRVDLVFRLKCCIVWYSHWFSIACWV